MHNPSPLTPYPATVTKIVDETGDVKTFTVEFDDPQVMENFGNKPGQVAQLSVFGEGEATISITSAPTRGKFLEFSVRRVGRLTNVLHQFEVGQKIGVRGPYGNWFPYEMMKGKDLFFIGGGIALAPIRSLIDFALSDQYRKDYGKVEILYGARSYNDLCFKHDLFERWPNCPNTKVYTTLDRPEEGWDGHVGFVPNYVEEVNPSPENKVAIICGVFKLRTLCLITDILQGSRQGLLLRPGPPPYQRRRGLGGAAVFHQAPDYGRQVGHTH
jgi:sulfhydrogenase subunit gamma (sulfur reductase)